MRMRPGTWDAIIVNSVLAHNEYGLPDDMTGAVVLDIGAHIGSFAVACRQRNAKRVICYEPDPENLLLLAENADDDPDSRTEFEIIGNAVLGDDATCGLRRLQNHDGDIGRNTGHVDVFGVDDSVISVGGIGINKVIAAIGEPIDLIKMDCEGAEWGILESGDFSNVRQIVAEVHAAPVSSHPSVSRIQGVSLRDLMTEAENRLTACGFDVRIFMLGSELGKLIAIKAKKEQPVPVEVHSKKKLLWIGDACTTTGYSKVTEQVCSRLYAAGWDVHVLGIAYNGDPHKFPYRIYPAVDPNYGGPRNGAARLKPIMDRIKPDVVLVQDDSWNVGIITDLMAVHNCYAPTVGYIAIDSENVRRDVAKQLNSLRHAICHTQFGVDQLAKAGYTGPVSIAGHGVTRDFAVYDKSEARSGIVLKKGNVDDAFIFGVVAVNQSRKRLDLSISYFAQWWRSAGKPENAYLYLHTRTHPNGAYDLRQIADFCGIRGQIIMPDSMLPSSHMPSLYNAFDVMISTSEGESFGIPVLEGASCGVPQIAVRCGGLPSWAGDAVYWVEPLVYSFAPDWYGTKRWIACEFDFVAAMNEMYERKDTREHYIKAGLELAKTFRWDDIASHFDHVLSGIVEKQKIVTRAQADALSEFE